MSWCNGMSSKDNVAPCTFAALKASCLKPPKFYQIKCPELIYPSIFFHVSISVWIGWSGAYPSCHRLRDRDTLDRLPV